MSVASGRAPACRLCGDELAHTFVDLGSTPLANSYLAEDDLELPEPRYPLHARVCEGCLLVQVDEVVPAERIFGEYAYFSSTSSTWLEHARRFAEASIARFGLGPGSRVVEVASNDGYLLRHFARAGIPVRGIEPAANVAQAAIAAGVPTDVRFFGREAAEDLRASGVRADLLVANNVLAHVPDLDGFVAGLARVLDGSGVLSIEVPHLLRLMAEVQFDTIYHEHFSYFSFLTAERALSRHGLAVFDVEELPTHGGSLRILASHRGAREPSGAVERVRAAERAASLDRLDAHAGFGERVARAKQGLVRFLDEAAAEGRSVVAYGAAAKGNTLLNTCGIDARRIQYVVDRSPHKQGRFLPGSRLPIHPPERVFETKPDDLLILPWNLREEIVAEMAGIREWGGRFVTAIPNVKASS